MKNILKYSFLVFGVVLFFSASAHAMSFPAPEVDPSLAIGGLFFLREHSRFCAHGYASKRRKHCVFTSTRSRPKITGPIQDRFLFCLAICWDASIY